MANPQIKRAFAESEYEPWMIQELVKCKKDPIYFIRNYIKIQHPKFGTIPFALYEYQERFIRTLNENRFVLTLMARQQGKTTTAAMYLLWYACFIDDATVLVASKNQSHALEIAARIRFAYEELPNWIKPGVKYYNRHNLEMDNGSKVISEATTEKTGRGLSISKIYLDELAFISPRIQEEMWSSLMPTLSTGGSAIISSTPNGDTELFAQLWRQAKSSVETKVAAEDGTEEGLNFVPFEVKWHEHPERGEAYYKTMLNLLGPVKTRQEVDCEFLSSDALLVSSITLNKLKTKPPVYEDMGFKFWAPPEKIGESGKTYLVGVDPATGGGSDFSVVQVFEFPGLIQIAEWRSNVVSPSILYAKVKWVLNFLGKPGSRGRSDVIWTFERNGVGEAMSALYLNDESPPEAELINDAPGRYGVFTSAKTKMQTCLQLKGLIERVNSGFTINSDILIHELKNFVARGGTYTAKTGSTDDAIMATISMLRAFKRLADYDEEAFRITNHYSKPDDPENPDDGYDEVIPILVM